MFSSKYVFAFLFIVTINKVITQEDCFNRALPPPSCTPLKSGLNPEEKNSILLTHNKLRQSLARGEERRGLNNVGQPAAKSMPDLEWDDQLEKLAQKWADTCNYEHDMCLFSNNMGQNIGFIASTDESVPNYLDTVKRWYDEVQYFDGSQVEKVTNFGRSAHYTQMISANTTKVGCGGITYKIDDMLRIQLVCNYSPFVNMVGNALYEKKAE